MMVQAGHPNAVIVLGMHRSGTSAVAGALGLLGVNLGERLVQAQADNPKGYWEHADAVQLHERLLAALDSSWEDPRPLPMHWEQGDAAREAARAASALLADQFALPPLWALKDPRQCRLLPLWRGAFAAHGVRPAFLHVVRDPAEVVASLRARDGLGGEHAALLWLRHVLEAEQETADAPRAWLDYAQLLADPVTALARAGETLGLQWPRSPDSCRDALVSFVDAGLRHQSAPAAPTGPAGELAITVYRRCVDAAATGRSPGFEEFRAELESLPLPADVVPGLAKALARSRADYVAQDARLAETDRALELARELSLQRLAELQGLDARLRQTDEALAETKHLSLERLAELQRLDAQLHAVGRSLEETKQLATARLAEIETLEALVRSERSRADAERSRVEIAEDRLRQMERSRSWRLTRPLRALSEWLAGGSGRSGSGDA